MRMTICRTSLSRTTIGMMIFLTLLSSSFKLRKLHLVRPDLIYYPLYVEVYA